MTRRRILWLLAAFAILVVAPASSAKQGPKPKAEPFPSLIQLPVGWQPEGIAVGKGHSVYVGSLATGSIWRGDLRTGVGAPVVTPPAGRVAVGIKVDNRGRIFVAGGNTGQGWVYSPSGETLASYTFVAPMTGFINDVVVTRTAAWFTNSNAAALYRVPIGADGSLGAQASVQTVPLGAPYAQGAGFNVNGITATPNGKKVIIVQSNVGRLFSVDAATGAVDLIELSGLATDVRMGDGILLHGKTLYVVENFSNRVAVVRLAADLGSGTIVRYLTDPDFDVPTTIARHGNRLYLPNARFGNPSPTTATYAIVRLDRK